MKRKVWDFDEWFALQHGKRPGNSLTDDEMLRIIAQGDYMRGVYRDRLDWDNRRTSALYAWQIPDMSKPITQRWHTTRRTNR